MEGVMMKNQDKYAVAVRKKDGTIEADIQEYKGVMAGSVLKKLPFVRGVFNFADSLILGMRALSFSADLFEEEPLEEADTEVASEGGAATDEHKEKKDGILMGVTMFISFLFAIALFMVLPYFLSQLLHGYVRNDTLMAVLEGVIRLAIFLIYIVGISAMSDIRRLYQYHGAEHKCINCIERGKPLTVRNVMHSSRLHKRCGTSFLLFVMVVSIILFFFIRVDNPVWKVVLRIILIPVIAGISYEIIRLAGSSNNIIVRILSAPGLMLQKLTTREPDAGMVEVAICSVEAVFDWKDYLCKEFHFKPEELEDDKLS